MDNTSKQGLCYVCCTFRPLLGGHCSHMCSRSPSVWLQQIEGNQKAAQSLQAHHQRWNLSHAYPGALVHRKCNFSFSLVTQNLNVKKKKSFKWNQRVSDGIPDTLCVSLTDRALCYSWHSEKALLLCRIPCWLTIIVSFVKAGLRKLHIFS